MLIGFHLSAGPAGSRVYDPADFVADAEAAGLTVDLRAGSYELLARADVPLGAVISEYVDVAKAFFDDREAKFANGVLDAVGKQVRPG